MNDNLSRFELHDDHGDLPRLSARKALVVLGCLIAASWIAIGGFTHWLGWW